MSNPQLHDGDLSLRAVAPGDIEAIRLWRNAQMEVLRQSAVISVKEQRSYYEEHIWPDMASSRPRRILLAIDVGGCLVGYGGLVHIDWEDRRAELSFLLEPRLEKNPPGRAVLFSRFLRLVQVLAFADLGLSRLWTETYAHRGEHISTLQASGFQLEGCLREHVIINGKPTDSLLHGLLLNEWREMN
jgi:RimJ/RimL family protein N-acetyltransferase